MVFRCFLTFEAKYNINLFHTFVNVSLQFFGDDHEVEFHEIEIQLFQEVEFFIMRSKFLIMNFCKNDQEIELALGALRELG
jgi:hypothetical protein